MERRCLSCKAARALGRGQGAGAASVSARLARAPGTRLPAVSPRGEETRRPRLDRGSARPQVTCLNLAQGARGPSPSRGTQASARPRSNRNTGDIFRNGSRQHMVGPGWAGCPPARVDRSLSPASSRLQGQSQLPTHALQLSGWPQTSAHATSCRPRSRFSSRCQVLPSAVGEAHAKSGSHILSSLVLFLWLLHF